MPGKLRGRGVRMRRLPVAAAPFRGPESHGSRAPLKSPHLWSNSSDSCFHILEQHRDAPHEAGMTQRSSGLGDPDYARFAWGRFRAVMAWMTVAAAACSAGAIMGLAHAYGPLNLVTMLAVFGGVGGSVMLAGALMGLVFLSSGTGHDEDVDEFNRHRTR